uniref:ribonuclease H n=1 Tax=Gasterosteus aculeatus aculeatus TaxID=481459 RepID=A0AAQ4RMY4_GASAC
MINDVLRDFLDHFVYVYIDDILIYSPDLDTHKRQVELVLQRLLDNGLYVKAEKSEFHATTVSFLGFIVAPGNVQMDSAKVPFRWSADADAAFRELKRRFTTAPILTLPDPARQFVVEVDASSEGIGAILSQRAEGDHKLHPCAFLSRRLTPAERNYDVGDRELLAVKAALEEWRHWLEGAQHPFLTGVEEHQA